EPPLVDMATRAARLGATVYFEAPPPRNPNVSVGYDPQSQANEGFQGSPAMASFYENLVATGKSRRWQYDDNAAVAVSTSSLSWKLTLPCEAWDEKLCVDGQVPVREGGTDAVHLDTPGCGAVRFALGLEERSLDTTLEAGVRLPDVASVTTAVDRYGGCH